MISFILQQAVAGLWAEVWRFGLGFGVMILLFAAAYFSPILKKDFLWAGVALGVAMIFFTTGVVVGEKRVRAQWASAEEFTAKQSEKAQSDAVRTVRRKPALRLRDNGDVYNRDRTKRPMPVDPSYYLLP